MNKHTIHLLPLGKTLTVNDKTPLIDVLNEFGIDFPCGGKGTCGKCKVKLLDGNIAVSESHHQKLEALGLSSEWRLACYSDCSENLTFEVDQFNHLILADETEFEFVPQVGFGIAIDLGTTTLVAQMIDLSTAKVLAVETRLNPQLKFGADLISRIQACLEGNAAEMTRMIRFSVGSMIELLLQKHDVAIQRVSIVGNTVMHHIFCDFDLSPLAVYPFHSAHLSQKEFDSSDLGWHFEVLEKVVFHASIGGFVGSDILAGIVATGLHQNEGYSALIDLGTNGEIVLGNKEQMVCASTAAGPAFEGTNISMGMRAVTGAISSMHIVDDEIKVNVIGHAVPKGLCGSALVDAVAILRKLDKIGPFGEIRSGDKSIPIYGKVELTQKDIYEFQLAKAAIAAGLEILCRTLSITEADIDSVYIAGGFGNYINVQHLVTTGMVHLATEKIHKRGNTALLGAKLLLFQNGKTAEQILAKTKHISLESDPNFQNTYLLKMLFEL